MTSATGELRRFRSYTYWSIVGVTALLLALFALTGPTPYPPDPVGTVSVAAIVVVVAAVFQLTAQQIPRVPGMRPLSARAWRAWAVAGLVAATVVAVPWARSGEPFLWSLAPAAVVSLLVAELPRDRRRTAIPVVVAGAAAVGPLFGNAAGPEGAAALAIGGAVVTGFWLFITLASVWTWRVVVQLDEARRTAATLAVANERLRFAGELHDIQGHSLQVIALKSELAARLVRQRPGAAEAEMAAVQRLAADALRDTREVVEGYRRASLATEIANAANVLGSAGTDARVDLDSSVEVEGLPSLVRHLLGLVVREAVTNVLRHSSARRSDIVVRALEGGQRVRLSVTNDGVREARDGDGGGLRQLADRVGDAGGELTWRRDGDRFEVEAILPVRVHDTVEEADRSA